MSFNSLAFLFGSGISIPSGFASVETITKEILSFCNKPEAELKEICKSMKYPYSSLESFELILILRDYMKDNYNRLSVNYRITYEDIYELLEILSEKDNDAPPAANIEFLKVICDKLYESNLNLSFFRHICTEAMHAKWFIQQKVKELLNISLQPKGLDVFKSIIESATGQVDILTLNHDYLLEHYLESIEVKFENGMIENGEIFEWNSDPYFLNKRATVSILKLHGSIDWKYFYFSDPSTRSNYKLGIARHLTTDKTDFGEIEPPRDKDGKPFTADFQLGFLVGKKTKAEYYNIVTYSEIFSTMTRLLKLHSLLIVAGYGFNDEFINHRIRYWTSQRNNKVLIFCQGSENEKASNVFSAISDYRHDHLKFINKFPSDFKKNEIKNLLDEILNFANA